MKKIEGSPKNLKQLLQNTLANVNQALSATKTSAYGFKD